MCVLHGYLTSSRALNLSWHLSSRLKVTLQHLFSCKTLETRINNLQKDRAARTRVFLFSKWSLVNHIGGLLPPQSLETDINGWQLHSCRGRHQLNMGKNISQKTTSYLEPISWGGKVSKGPPINKHKIICVCCLVCDNFFIATSVSDVTVIASTFWLKYELKPHVKEALFSVKNWGTSSDFYVTETLQLKRVLSPFWTFFLKKLSKQLNS